MQVPLFPLNTVLFPGGPLPLRIFEPRYLDMISNCVKNDAPFGVLLIREGGETGPATTHAVGTLARIIDWYQGNDGLLGVTAIGEQRFRVLSSHRESSGLNVGNVEILDAEPTVPLPEEYRALPAILAGVLDDLGLLWESLERHMDDAAWVTSRFVEILPLDLEQKQQCLESGDPEQRLQIVQELLDSSRGWAVTDLP
ncbi:MAG: LON peptidase substrate-binding domain-containing protein [Gammaproteobacteria bacterium]|nr:LON peptidase substrate-binding domain-containing protein [Gammaproteobacteria bacterium]MDH3750020.1 LON peptidase substrate-binding domain-containing protein [Gammaproteobacteria bacterium]MDH3804025.1 LON peptidase substrate-binding domain-containing protein [Gammaproteobacteria bacterium]